MGSRSIFAPSECHACEGIVPRTQPPTWLCVNCTAGVQRRLIFDHPPIRGDAYVGLVTDIVLFIVKRDMGSKKYFLWRALTAPHSCFWQFMYITGGVAGNISTTEDILDRIMMFL